ncbi:unnamed protein product [Lymnaea stagnalis]|uniref:G-protein coupled receptors family 2 profile 2 domain-containing protein n=1 Tax=Lymnaea stagnalis TaxID=6523 RepID=A0AAV2HYD0_LYMST
MELSCVVLCVIWNALSTVTVVLSFRDLNWDSLENKWLDFHVKFCGRVCNGSQLVIAYNDCDRAKTAVPKCLPCDCEPSCYIYDTCCPTLTDGVLTQPVYSDSGHLPRPERFVCKNFPSYSNFYAISDCSEDFLKSVDDYEETKTRDGVTVSHDAKTPRDVAIQQCEHPKTETMDDVIPYLDLNYGIVFKNKFCALCNGYQIVHRNNIKNDSHVDRTKLADAWSLQVSCDHYQYLFNITSELEFFNTALNKNGCRIKYSSPKSNFPPKECQANMQVDLESTCVSSADTTVNENCLNLSRRYLKVESYRNIFCYLCAGSKPGCSSPSRVPGVEPLVPPISLLLSFDTNYQPKSPEHKTCNFSSEWRNKQDKCSQAECSPGKLATKNETCSSAIKEIRGLGYKMAMRLVASQEIIVSDRHVQGLHEETFQKLSSLSTELELTTIIKVGEGSNVLEEVSLCAFLIGPNNTQRDYFESLMVKRTQRTWDVRLLPNTALERNVTLRPILLGFNLNGLQTSSCWDYSRTAQYRNGSVTVNRFERMYFIGAGELNSSRRTGQRIYQFGQKADIFPKRLWHIKKDFIDVTYSLTCPYVVVNLTKLSIEDHSASVSFEHEGRIVELTSLQNISLVDDQLRICIDLFKMATRVTQSTDIVIQILYYFQVVCVSVSIVCLILSFATFCLFPSLRSLPGLNNMSLCLSLAIAQTCLLITVQNGVHGVLPPIYCLLHAIVLHYSWLASFLWMSACCIHMFRVFTCHGNQFINTRSDKQRHLKYCLYAYGVPLLIVAFTLATNAALTSGATLGYDDTICFLDTRTSAMNIALSLLLPLCCMVLSNGVLFALTVRGIIHVTKIQETTTRRDSQGVMTYVKLSTLTGVFCIVAAVSVWLNNIPLQFVTSPLMALQGVFVFFSFIVNRRVGKLYSNLWNKKGFHDQSSSSSRSRKSDSTSGRSRQTLLSKFTSSTTR